MQVWQGSALAGVYPLVLASALKRRKEGCSAHRHLGLLFLAGLGGVSPCLLTALDADCFPGNSALDMRTLAWVSSYAK